MTEDEAKTKWCPHTRQAVAIDCKEWSQMTATTSNRNLPGGAEVDGCNCIAAGCMAWRRFYDTGDAIGYCGAFGRAGAP